MKIKKYFLLILSLIFINFLNLNAATTKGNIRKLSSQKAIAEINLTYKYVENGEYTEIYDENGNLITEANLINEKMGELTKTYPEGIVKNYYPNGILKSKIEFKKGLGNGIYETYYENGKLFEKTTMKNGKPDGKYEVYGPDGKLEESVFYKNGEVVNK